MPRRSCAALNWAMNSSILVAYATKNGSTEQVAGNYLEVVFDQQGVENSGWLSDELVTSIAASIPGLGVHRLLDERHSAEVKADATAVDAAIHGSGVTSTPTFVVGKTGTVGTQVALSGPHDEQGLVRAIEAAL